MKTWVVFLVCLNTMACFHNVDGTKVKCTTSDHCPTNFVCSGGKCVGSSTSTDARSSETAPVAVDSSGVDTKPMGPDVAGPQLDVAPSGSDVEAFPDTPADLPSETDVPMLGTGGAGGSAGAGGGSTGGAPGSGGVIGSGGVSTTGGTVSSGGTVATGGVPATGGTTGTGGSTCQPKPRDCTSALDNDCNGTPDKQETTFCACTVGQARPCQEHPGYDGTGICKAGSQTCAASADKTTSSWSACSGAVGPGTEVCDVAGLDENCNGQSNEGCECVNGANVPCDCGPATTCTNGKKGTCSVSKVTMYRDYDGDQHGDATQPLLVCPNTAGYVTSSDDCDDRDATFYPGVSLCATATQIKSCASGGATSRTTCDYGCAGGKCHPASDGTIGLPGYVSCTNVSNCLAGDGCVEFDPSGSCGTTAGGVIIYCDGPNDCPGQKCVMYFARALNEAKCYPSVPTVDPSGNGGTYSEVCDPMASTCQAPQVCTKQGLYPLYACE